MRLTSCCPWWLPDSDLNAVGEPELTRHLIGQRQIAMHVTGTYGVDLGMVAMRVERIGGEWVPTSICIPEDPYEG